MKKNGIPNFILYMTVSKVLLRKILESLWNKLEGVMAKKSPAFVFLT